MACTAALLIADGTTNGPPLRTQVTTIDTTLPGTPRGDPALADRVGDIERAVHDDIGDGVEAAWAEVLGAGDEVAGGVVDERGQRTVAEDVLDHRVHRGGVADVDAIGFHRPAVRFHHRFGRGVANALPPSADDDLGPEPEQALGHRPPQPRSPAGHEDFLALEQVLLEHLFPPWRKGRILRLVLRQGKPDLAGPSAVF